MKVLSLFSGIGAFEKALDVLKIPYELVGYCEIDKYASKSYSAIHDVPETMNLGDITKIDEKALPKDIDLITYGFPCQDISLAGKQKGLFNEDGSQTRSGLFFEALRIIEETQPKVAIAENVKNLVGKKFNAQFQIVLASLEAAGYNNYWQVLNAKDYGIPQNRERVFIVSIRKDIDTGSFKFPEPFPLELRLKDMLEDVVDEKFYLSNTQTDKLNINNESRLNEINMLGMLDIKGNEQVRRVYGTDGISPTLNTMQGGNRQPKVLLEPYAEAVIEPFIVASRGRNPDNPSDRTPGSPTVQRLEPNCQGICNTLTTVQKDNYVVEPVIVDDTQGFDGTRIYKDYSPSLRASRNGLKVADSQQGVVISPTASFVNGDVCKTVRASGHGSVDRHSWDMVHHNLRIRKLTPKECFRLMGFSDEDFAKAEAVNSNTQLYKQAGNSIVVDVIAHILKELKGVLMNES
jgi:DNA (cytosine-5)-methyltransferase 1